jgi:hypothetical protein
MNVSIMIGRAAGILTRPRVLRPITCAWLLLVIIGSLQPNRLLEVVGLARRGRLRVVIGSVEPPPPRVAAGPRQPAGTGPVVDVDLHRQIHWLAFGGAALLLLLPARNRRREICAVLAAFLLGLSLEYLQHLIYRNPMEWYDVRDDGLAILAALALYRLSGSRHAAPAPAAHPFDQPAS